jgi:cell division protease FtsH
MSEELGPLALLPADGAGPLLPGASEVSSKTQERIDGEVGRLVADAHKQVLALLADNRDKLDALASALVEHETLDEDDAYAAAGVPHERQIPAEAASFAAAMTSDEPEAG